MNAKLLTPTEAGRLLGVSESRVRQYLRAGVLTGKRQRRHAEWLIPVAEVKRFRKVKPPRGRPRKILPAAVD